MILLCEDPAAEPVRKLPLTFFFITNKCDGHRRHTTARRRQWDRPVVAGRSVPVLNGGVETAPKLFSALCFENTSQEGPRRWGRIFDNNRAVRAEPTIFTA